MLRLPREYYAKRTHSLCVDLVTIHKISAAQEARPGTDVPFLSGNIDAMIIMKNF
jgi:hypothetical protein